MSKFLVYLFCLLTIIGMKNHFVLCQEGQEVNINIEWLKRDIFDIQKLRSSLPPINNYATDFVKCLHSFGYGCEGGKLRIGVWETEDDLGFGARKLELAKFATHQYASFWIYILVFEDYIIQVEIICKGNTFTLSQQRNMASWPAIKATIEESWGSDIYERFEEGIKYKWSDPQRLALFHDAIARELGPPDCITIPDNLQESYETLTSPLSRVHFGWDNDRSVTIPGWRLPPGRKAIDELKKHNRIDIIRNILRGPDPEGRIYAYDALLELEQEGIPIAEPDKIAMDKIGGLQITLIYNDGYGADILTTSEMLLLVKTKHYTSQIEKFLKSDDRFSNTYVILGNNDIGTFQAPFYGDIPERTILNIMGIIKNQDDFDALKNLIYDTNPPIKIRFSLGEFKGKISPRTEMGTRERQ